MSLDMKSRNPLVTWSLTSKDYFSSAQVAAFLPSTQKSSNQTNTITYQCLFAKIHLTMSFLERINKRKPKPKEVKIKEVESKQVNFMLPDNVEGTVGTCKLDLSLIKINDTQ